MEAIDSKEKVATPSMGMGAPRYLHVQFDFTEGLTEGLTEADVVDESELGHLDIWINDTLDRDGRVRARVGEALTKFLEESDAAR